MNNKKKNNNKNVNINRNKNNKSNVVKLNTEFKSKNLICYKKLKTTIIVLIIIFILLLGRLAYIQFIQGDYLKELAYQQQNINQIISPKRGNIYDSTGKALAISASVDTVTINPTKIKDKNDDEEKTKQLKETVAKGLSEIFELDYNEVLEKVNSESSVQTIVRKVEQDKIDQLKSWMEE